MSSKLNIFRRTRLGSVQRHHVLNEISLILACSIKILHIVVLGEDHNNDHYDYDDAWQTVIVTILYSKI